MLEDRKAQNMNMRNEIHAHKEAIVGHIKDKEYLDSRLAQVGRPEAHGARVMGTCYMPVCISCAVTQVGFGSV